MRADSLKELREKLGKQDQEILRLLNERGRLALEVGRVKTGRGRKFTTRLRRPRFWRN